MQQRDLSIQTVDDFIAAYPVKTQAILQEIRSIIKNTNSELEEKISYGIPTFTLGGKNLVHFSAYEHHIGFYPGSAAIAVFHDELTRYKTSKGTVQFPIDKPMPLELIKKMTVYCIEERTGKNK